MMKIDENRLRPWLYPSELLTTMSHTEQVKPLDYRFHMISHQLDVESVFCVFSAKASGQRLHL